MAVLEASLKQELRRGSLIMAVLSALRVQRYGYSLKKTLSDAGVEIQEGPLYPMLRRLESQGLLTSAWHEDGSRKRRYYRLTPAGDHVLASLHTEWTRLDVALRELLEGENIDDTA